jgi:hypothetical protein
MLQLADLLVNRINLLLKIACRPLLKFGIFGITGIIQFFKFSQCEASRLNLFDHQQMVNFNSGTTGIAHYIGAVIYRLTGISEEKGTQTILNLTTLPEHEKVSGQYFSEGKATRSSDLSYDLGIRKRLWSVSQALIQQYAPIDAVPT